MTPKISMAELETAMSQRGTRLTPAVLEAFEDDRKRYLGSAALALVLRSIIGYNAFLLLDYALLPRTFPVAIFLHLCVVTPYMVFAVLVLRRQPSMIVRDGLGMFFPILIMLQIMIIYRLNSGLADDQYQYLAIMCMIYTNNNQLLNMRFAALASAATAAIYLAALLTGPSPEPVRVTGIAMLFACAYLSLEAKGRLERSARYTFLRRMYDRLQRHEAENEASRDALTGLSNRRHFEERVAALTAATGGNPTSIALVMLDIDHFKLFNDRYGHPAGDHCLKRVAGVLSATLRGRNDLAVRYGGEEFLLFLPDTSLETAIQIAERVRRAIETMDIPHDASPTGKIVTASLGVAAGPSTAAGIDPILAQADAALYKAKHAGRNHAHPTFISTEPVSLKVWRTAS